MTDERAARDAASRMAEAAAEFVDGLDEQQRARAAFSFDNEARRTDWAYFPREHAGVPLHAMDIRQQKLAHRLVATSLSLPAYARVCSIMALESVLNEIEQRRGDRVRDPGRYFFSLFGAPAAARWGWRLEGHHICLNFTCVDGEAAAATPLFLGANPATVRHGDANVLRPCGEEEDGARSLLEMLDVEQRAAAIICDEAPPDFVLTNMPRVPNRARAGSFLPELPMVRRAMQPAWEAFEPHKDKVAFGIDRPLGLAAGRMNAAQRSAVSSLVDVYLDRLPEPLARLERERAHGAGLDALHFAWAGSTRRREGHYYRLQSPAFLAEYDNTQDGANHVHAVWRDPHRDFGMDVLRSHVRGDH